MFYNLCHLALKNQNIFNSNNLSKHPEVQKGILPRQTNLGNVYFFLIVHFSFYKS